MYWRGSLCVMCSHSVDITHVLSQLDNFTGHSHAEAVLFFSLTAHPHSSFPLHSFSSPPLPPLTPTPFHHLPSLLPRTTTWTHQSWLTGRLCLQWVPPPLGCPCSPTILRHDREHRLAMSFPGHTSRRRRPAHLSSTAPPSRSLARRCSGSAGQDRRAALALVLL